MIHRGRSYRSGGGSVFTRRDPVVVFSRRRLTSLMTTLGSADMSSAVSSVSARRRAAGSGRRADTAPIRALSLSLQARSMTC